MSYTILLLYANDRLKESFEKLGYRVVYTQNVIHAYGYYKQGGIDGMILDGDEYVRGDLLAEDVRKTEKNERTPRIPIILCTDSPLMYTKLESEDVTVVNKNKELDAIDIVNKALRTK